MKTTYTIIILTLMSLQQLHAQNGAFDAQLTLANVDCSNMKLYIDVSIKANSNTTNFRLAEQNYRISFIEDVVANPFIETELDVSGFITHPDQTISLYNPHTLAGSIDSIVSYNVELAGGDGFPLTEVNWTKVGRLGFDIINLGGCFYFTLHDDSPISFPPTFVSEMLDGNLTSADGINYESITYTCLADLCAIPPSAGDDNYDVNGNSPFTINFLDNDVDLNGNLDPSSFSLLSSPPSTELLLAPTSNPGEYLCTPASGFTGTVTPFDYEICDTDSQCSTATVSIIINGTTSLVQPENTYTINLHPTIVTNEIVVEYLNIDAGQNTTIIITDMNGKVLQRHQKDISSNPVHRFEVQELAQGVYFLTTMIDGQSVTRKFVKL